MKYTKRASIAVSLLVASPALAQQASDEPIPAGYPPLIIEAEGGSGGADFVPGNDGSASFVEIAPSAATPGAPGTAARVLSYAIQLPAPGEYELYARVRVGPGGGSDDSLFYASSFGEKDPLSESDWIIANNLVNVGYQLPEQIVAGDFGLPLGAGFRWINLSEYNGGEAPVRFSAAEGELAQTLQIGAREDGLAIDKLALVAADVSQTVAELDAGLPGHILPPPPPPRACVSRGPALAAQQSKFLGCAFSAAQQPSFASYFNQVTPENGGKWGSVEAVRDVMNWTDLDAAYSFAKQNGLPIKMHTLIWGNQQPAWIETLSPEEQLQEIEEWFAAVAERYPDLDQVDVVNEPLHDPPTQAGNGGGNYAEALGGAGATGWDWVLTSFRMARQYFPRSELLLNDYSIINNPADVERYKQIVELLQAEDLIDGIGEQGHAFSTRGDTAVMAASLDSLAELGLPIYITELDIDGPTDEVQLAEYQRLFPLFWEHPAVAGITLWGYLPGHWRTAQGAFLALAGGTERPALQWLREYLGSPASVPVLSGQRLVVSERAQPGQAIGVAQADADAPNHWLILGGTGADSFEIDPDSGELRVAAGAILDAATTPELTLELVARDECNSTELVVEVRSNTAPILSGGQVIALDSDLQAAGSVQALDAEGDLLRYEIVGGSGADFFRIDAATGALAPSRGLRLDSGEQTLLVTASDGELTSEPELVTITLPRRVALCARGQTWVAPRSLASLALHLGAELGRCETSPPSWTSSLRSWLLQLLQRVE